MAGNDSGKLTKGKLATGGAVAALIASLVYGGKTTIDRNELQASLLAAESQHQGELESALSSRS